MLPRPQPNISASRTSDNGDVGPPSNSAASPTVHIGLHYILVLAVEYHLLTVELLAADGALAALTFIDQRARGLLLSTSCGWLFQAPLVRLRGWLFRAPPQTVHLLPVDGRDVING